eukprot:SAG31_NODE_2624_length_5360_cov_2.184946_9_plen_96_part_00
MQYFTFKIQLRYLRVITKFSRYSCTGILPLMSSGKIQLYLVLNLVDLHNFLKLYPGTSTGTAVQVKSKFRSQLRCDTLRRDLNLERLYLRVARFG